MGDRGVPVSIRAATMDDYAGLCALMAEVHRLHLDQLPYLFRETEGPVCGRDYLQRLIDDEQVGLFVAELDGALVGFVNVALREAPDIPIIVPRCYAHISDVVVRHDHWRAGIGRALMDRAHRWARDQGATAVELNVYEFNDGARAFYQVLGYETVSRRMGRRL